MIKVKLQTNSSDKTGNASLEDAELKYKDAIEKFEKSIVEMGNKYVLDNILIQVKVDEANHAEEYELVQSDDLKKKLTNLFVTHFLQS